MTKPELIAKLTEEVNAFEATLKQANNDAFFSKPDQKWSVAENAQHLVLSGKPLNLAFTLPRFVLRMLFGTPNRKSSSYDEVVKRYQQKLKDGGKSPRTFEPGSISVNGDKEKIIARFKDTYGTLINKAQTLSEEEMENYLLPHPLMGKLTVREMLCFTAYHVSHHHQAVKARL